jgi:hypothetical protein
MYCNTHLATRPLVGSSLSRLHVRSAALPCKEKNALSGGCAPRALSSAAGVGSLEDEGVFMVEWTR